MADDSELLQSISRQIGELVRRELEHAKDELRANAKSLGAGGALVGSAGVLATYGGAAATAGVGLLLSRRMPPWLAAFVTGAGASALAAAMATQGMKQIRDHSPVPTETLHDVDDALGAATTRPNASGPA